MNKKSFITYVLYIVDILPSCVIIVLPGFLESSAEDERCLSRQSDSYGLPPLISQVVYVPDVSSLYLLLKDGVVSDQEDFVFILS